MITYLQNIIIHAALTWAANRAMCIYHLKHNRTHILRHAYIMHNVWHNQVHNNDVHNKRCMIFVHQIQLWINVFKRTMAPFTVQNSGFDNCDVMWHQGSGSTLDQVMSPRHSLPELILTYCQLYPWPVKLKHQNCKHQQIVLLTWIIFNPSIDKQSDSIKMWYENIYPFPNIDGCSVEDWDG